MERKNTLLLLIFLFFLIRPGFSQSVVISSYDNENDLRDEWTELLVVVDNTDMRNWQLMDNNATQTGFRPAITFNDIPLWNNMRAGTVIMIHHRSVNSTGAAYPVNLYKSQGYIEVSANDVNYFNGGDLGTFPLYIGETLNIAKDGDLLRLVNATGTFVHALGHRPSVGSSWGTLPSTPKLNHQSILGPGYAVFVCRGSALSEYGTDSPQDGTQWTAMGNGTAKTFGLPNVCSASATDNSDFWRSIRQPVWLAPNLTGVPNASNTQITLSWNAATDPFPSDSTQGYLVIRSTSGAFGTPVDGTTYITGNVIGTGYVIGVIKSSQINTFVDNYVAPCTGGVFYRVYAFRYTTDYNGNSYDVARGRAYNEDDFGQVTVTGPAVTAGVTISATSNPVCENTSVTFTAVPSGQGTSPTYQWLVNGMNAGASSPVYTYIPSNGDNVKVIMTSSEPCVPVNPVTSNIINMTVNPVLPVTATITANPGSSICAGTSVTFTAVANGGGPSPVFQWYVNGNPVGVNSISYTYIPADGDQVFCHVTSSLACPGPPANSNTITISYSAALTVGVTISANPGTSVCAGTTVIFTAIPVNGGSSPVYQWFVNGNPAGTNSATYTYIPGNSDQVYCKVTSSLACAGPPGISNTLTISYSTALVVEVTISANPGTSVCAGTTVIFNAIPVNGGSSPVYQWFVNGNPAGTNSDTYSYVPGNSDQVYCKVTSSLACAGPPGISNTLTITYTTALVVGVTISANTGTSVCAGTMVIYTAVPVNGGTSPVYQWYVNGTPVGTNADTYTYVPANADQISCKLTSSLSCAGSPGNSNILIMDCFANLVVSVTIAADPGTTVCVGTPVVFTAHPQNGGLTPVIHWKVNGNPATGTDTAFTYIPSNGDIVSCDLISSLSCASVSQVSSNQITMTVVASMPLTVSLAMTPSAGICEGIPINFNATATNGGSTAVYEWFLNGSPAGLNAPDLTIAAANGDKVFCRITSGLSCVTNSPANTDTITVSADASVMPAITILPNHTAKCPGMVVVFTANISNEGSNPQLDWFVDGVNVQQGAMITYSTDSLTSTQTVSCRLTSSLSCAIINPVLSALVTIPDAPDPVVSLTDKNFLCLQDSPLLDAGAGFSSYLWQDGSTFETFLVSQPGLYHVSVTDSLGCAGSDSVLVKDCIQGIYLPTAFSPDGDGLNDVFKMVTGNEDIADFSMVIFNRWGEMVFETNDLKSGWDGTFKAKQALSDTYIWKITYKNIQTDTRETLHGTILLIR